MIWITLLGLHFILAPDFRAWQFVTYMFMHGGVTHLLMNMFMLWMFGMVVENVWGPKKFLFYYMVCGLGAGVCQELAQYGTYVVEGLAQYETVRIANSIIPMSEYLNMMNTVGASWSHLWRTTCLRYVVPRRAYVHHTYPCPY